MFRYKGGRDTQVIARRFVKGTGDTNALENNATDNDDL